MRITAGPPEPVDHLIHTLPQTGLTGEDMPTELVAQGGWTHMVAITSDEGPTPSTPIAFVSAEYLHDLFPDLHVPVPSRAEALLRPGEVARLLRVTPKTVARWADEGRIPSIKTAGGHNRYPAHAVYQLRSAMERNR